MNPEREAEIAAAVEQWRPYSAHPAAFHRVTTMLVEVWDELQRLRTQTAQPTDEELAKAGAAFVADFEQKFGSLDG